MKRDDHLKFSTRIINKSPQKADVHGAINTPIYKNAAFEFKDSVSIANAFQNKEAVASHTYSRITNPSVSHFEEKVKAAAKAHHVMAFSSGMAAIANTFMAMCYTGCNIVSSPHLFGNTFSFFQFTLADFGVEVRFVDTDDLEAIEAALDEHTVAFFCELLTNPHLEIADLPKISAILKAHDVPMVIDTTLIPWCAFEPKLLGIDIEVVSTTKYISGGATSLGGVIVDHNTFDWSHNQKLKKVSSDSDISPFMFKIRREIARNFGATMDPDVAYLQSLGLESLEVRYKKMSENTASLACFLVKCDNVVSVNYPELENSPYKTLSDQFFTLSPSAMLTFKLATKEDCFAFMDHLTIIRRSTNLFDHKSLIIHPESTIYGPFNDELKAKMGIIDNELRLSVGLEDLNDLQNDITEALKAV